MTIGHRRRQGADKKDFGKLAILPLQRLIDSVCLSVCLLLISLVTPRRYKDHGKGERKKQTSNYCLHA